MIKQVKKMTAQFCEPKVPSNIIINEYSPESLKLFSVIKDLAEKRQYLYLLHKDKVPYYIYFSNQEEKNEEMKKIKKEVEILETEKLNCLYLFNQKIRQI